MVEKRQFERFTQQVDVRMIHQYYDNAHPHIELYGKSVDISGSGIMIYTNRHIPIGETLKLSFIMPNTFEFFSANAETVRVDDKDTKENFSIGFRFLNLSQRDKERLDYYLRLR